MKKILLSLATVAVMFSCGSTQKEVSIKSIAGAQLWSPIAHFSPSSLPYNITPRVFNDALIKAIQKFYIASAAAISLNNSSVTVAGRAWYNDFIYTLTMYKEHINEYRRGNNYVMFNAAHLK